MTRFTRFDSKYWEMILAGDESGLTRLHMVTGRGKRTLSIPGDWRRDDDFFTDAKNQVLEYLAGRRTGFDLALNPSGTEFQKRVWEELRAIPFGQVRTYGEIARAIGDKKACRAVGMANSRNPVPIIIPCHRVVGAGGRLAGFAHGVETKRTLLDIEGVCLGRGYDHNRLPLLQDD